MPKLPVLSGKDVIKVLEKIRYGQARITGSHAILNKHDSIKGKITIVVPLHHELAKGTLKSIMGQAGLSLDDLLKLIK